MSGRQRTQRGRPDYHNPLGGVGGAAPAQSALTLRLVLAAIGLVVSVAGAVLVVLLGAPWWLAALLVVIAVTAAVDIVVVARRKRRGEPG